MRRHTVVAVLLVLSFAGPAPAQNQIRQQCLSLLGQLDALKGELKTLQADFAQAAAENLSTKEIKADIAGVNKLITATNNQLNAMEYRLPFANPSSGATWRVCRGNIDDPSGNPHTAADEAFAFDFVRGPCSAGGAGGKILAARAGNVLDIEESLNCNTSAGSCANCGNFIRVQHTDGTVARYCHAQQNSVSVAAGQPVARGKALGLVGNTGNSSTPHIHLEVRTGDVAGALSLPIVFRDVTRRCWRPRIADAPLVSTNVEP